MGANYTNSRYGCNAGRNVVDAALEDYLLRWVDQLAEEGPGPCPELDAKIIAAVRAAPPPGTDHRQRVPPTE